MVAATLVMTLVALIPLWTEILVRSESISIRTAQRLLDGSTTPFFYGFVGVQFLAAYRASVIPRR